MFCRGGCLQRVGGGCKSTLADDALQVLARSAPSDKQLLVGLLQEMGEVSSALQPLPCEGGG